MINALFLILPFWIINHVRAQYPFQMYVTNDCTSTICAGQVDESGLESYYELMPGQTTPENSFPITMDVSISINYPPPSGGCSQMDTSTGVFFDYSYDSGNEDLFYNLAGNNPNPFNGVKVVPANTDCPIIDCAGSSESCYDSNSTPNVEEYPGGDLTFYSCEG